jgi:hypothetical protein
MVIFIKGSPEWLKVSVLAGPSQHQYPGKALTEKALLNHSPK